jgi:hypothetical protein
MDRYRRTMALMDSETALFVLSDHGFTSFERGVRCGLPERWTRPLYGIHLSRKRVPRSVRRARLDG